MCYGTQAERNQNSGRMRKPPQANVETKDYRNHKNCEQRKLMFELTRSLGKAKVYRPTARKDEGVLLRSNAFPAAQLMQHTNREL
jgi:hypothetical protein